MKTFEIATKRSKRKQRWLIVLLSLFTLGTLAVGVKILSGKIISNKAREIGTVIEVMDAVAYPNSSSYTWLADGGDWWTGGIKGRRAKDIYGVWVDQSEYRIRFNWLVTKWGDAGFHTNGTYTAGGRYNLLNHQKIPQFYNINVEYKDNEVISEPTQELTYLKDMPNQLVEVAITFDKPYTLKEIKKMVPDNLQQNWYWIGTESKGDSSHWSDSDLFGVSNEGFTRLDIDYEHKLSDGSYDTEVVDAFLSNLKKVSKLPGQATYNAVTPRDDVESYLKTFGHLDTTKAEDLAQLTFSGIILTGPSENFAQLDDRDWIYASSIGTTIPNQPYYQLKKE